MTNKTRFIFSDHLHIEENIFFARLAKNICTQEQLLNSLAQCLKFPIYFGFNWNALFDCLKDFHWIEEPVVILMHEKLPQLNESDLKIYLEILVDAIDHWKSENNLKFEVIFLKSDQLKVMRLIDSAVHAIG